MGFLSDLGNIFHAIGGFFEGGDNNNAPQNNNHAVVVAPQNNGGRPVAPNSFNGANNQNGNQNNNQQPNQRPNDPLVSLIQPNNRPVTLPANSPFNNGPVNANTFEQAARLQKAQQAQNSQPGNDPVGNVVGGIAKTLASPFVYLGKTDIVDPTRELVAQATGNKAAYNAQERRDMVDLGLSTQNPDGSISGDNFGNGLKKWAGNSAGAILTVAAPGVDSAIEKGTASLLPTATTAAERVASKVLPKVVSGSTLGGGFGGANAAANNQDILQGIGSGVEVGGPGGLLFGTIPLLRRGASATDSADTAALDSAANKAGDEVAVGVKSANPNQGADALKVISEKEAQANAAQPVAPEAGQTGTPETPANQLQSAEAPTTPGQNPTQPVQTSLPLQGSPLATEGTAPTQPLKVENTSSPENVAQTQNNVNPQVKNARFNQAVIDNANDPVFKQAFTSDPIEKDGAPLSQLNDAAVQKVQQMDLPTLVQHYGQDFEKNTAGPIANEGQYYEYLQAIRQLEQHAGDPTAAQAAANALDAVNTFAYERGRGLAATRLAYDQMPAGMKVAYLTRLITKAGGELSAADQTRLLDAANLQTQLAQKAQEAENAVSKYASDAATKDDPQFNQNMKNLLATEQAADAELYSQNKNILDLLQQNLPKSDLGTRVAQQARTSMLSSIGGRGFALGNTAFNTAHWLTDNTLSSIIGRAINGVGKLTGVVNDNTAVRTSVVRPGTLVKGAGSGIKTLANDTFGNPGVKDVTQSLTKPYDSDYSHDTTRYGFIGSKITAPIRKLVRFGVGTHMAVTKGVEDATLEQSARQSAQQLGVPKANLQGYVDYYKAHPPQVAADEAKQAWLGVNNLHKNGVSDALGKVADTIEKAGGSSPVGSFAAKQIRTVVIPFSHYMGGYLDKALTDRNMFYNMYQIGKEAVNVAKDGSLKDPQALSDQLAHLTTNAGTAIGGGYMLAKAGLITNKDQNGKNYDGLYLHFGNRYIPIGFLGQSAIPMIMGATFQMSQKDGTNGGSFLKNLTGATLQSADDILKTTGVAGNFGSSNNLFELLSGNTEAALPKIAGGVVSQHIPAVTGDVNAVLNQTGLNPTHETPNTKVTTTNSTTGRQVTDQTATEINKVKAQIPVLSQTLPRNPGAAAPTELDRVLHSGNSSPSQIQQAANLKKVGSPAQTAAQLKADKVAFKQSNKSIDTINGKTYVNYKGKISSYDNPTEAQQALDYAQFKDSNSNFEQKNGMVYQKDNNGKALAPMQQKDFDYKTADDQITSSKNSGDVTGYSGGIDKLLGNIGWQLQHANLSQAQRDALVQKAVQTQEDYAKTQQYGGFTKPKGVASYATPQITGAKDGYVKAIQEAGAKYGVDINALLSVAAQEGLGGGVGDNGTSFGPFQLHEGGALPPGKDQAWAESPAGIDYAVQQIANVAKGKTGAEAIAAIVNGFEKSADPTGEIARAEALYNGGSATLASGGTGVASLTPNSASSASAASLVKNNKIGSLPSLPRESFVSNLSAKPISVNIPQVKLTAPESLIKQHKISVGMPRA